MLSPALFPALSCSLLLFRPNSRLLFALLLLLCRFPFFSFFPYHSCTQLHTVAPSCTQLHSFCRRLRSRVALSCRPRSLAMSLFPTLSHRLFVDFFLLCCLSRLLFVFVSFDYGLAHSRGREREFARFESAATCSFVCCRF